MAIVTEPGRVTMYATAKHYGFVETVSGGQVFFLRADFNDAQIPPITGEQVEVVYDPERPTSKGKHPRANAVLRQDRPEKISARVEFFNQDRGYGFASDGDTSYYVHWSDVLDGRQPAPGQVIQFYPGERRGRPRAFYVEVP